MPCSSKAAARPVRLGKNGFSAPDDEENFFEFLWPNPTDAYRAPDWASEQVYYQIFPERFRNGEASNDPPGAEPWGAPPTRENFQGGDLRGIIEKLGYIRDLGATCLYLTPIFKAPSNHKYDTVDYFDIDPAFGTKDDLAELGPQRPQARAAGAARRRIQPLRVLLAAVSGCGAKRRKLRLCLLVFPAELPGERKAGKLRLRRPLQMDAEDQSGGRRSEGLFHHGRQVLDTQLPHRRLAAGCGGRSAHAVLGAFSDAIKKENPEALLLGERGGGAPAARPRPARQRDELSLPGRRRGLARKGSISPAELDHRLNRMLSLYPWETALRLYNPLDSHDTERFRWLCRDKRRHALAAALQMTFPGCPAVFYGDEVGLSGGNDPDCRLAMEWDEEKQNKELLALYRKLIGIRRESPSLLRGDFRACLCDDVSNVYAFRRTCGEDESLVVLNAGSEPVKTKIAAEGTWTPRISGRKPVSSESGGITVDLAPCSAEIYLKKAKGRK